MDSNQPDWFKDYSERKEAAEKLQKIARGVADTEDNPEDDTQWIVYVLGENGLPLSYFLAVCDSRAEASEERDRWWKAFDTGEKEKPMGYGGISIGPVSDFEEWRGAE